MSDIVKQLNAYGSEDHERGCAGREYSCECGYDARGDELMQTAAATIARLEAENVRFASAHAAFIAQIDAVQPCGDGNCVVRRPMGQHTNGGCRCWREPLKAQRMMMAARNLRAALTTLASDEAKP